MVKHRLLLVTLSVLLVFMVFGASVSGARVYHLSQEWVKIWINQNGTIDLFYNVSLTLDSGDDIHFAYIGQPKRDFTIGEAVDQYGNILVTSDASSGSDYKVQVNLHSTLTAGQTVWFTLLTNVAHMVYENTSSSVGMQFIPTWWSEATVADLRILIVLPPNVTVGEVGVSPYWDNTSDENGSLAIYWERHDLQPNEQLSVGVSFPKQYVQQWDTKPPDNEPPGFVPSLRFYEPWLSLAFVLGIVFVVLGAVVYVVNKRPYLMPKLSMETLGVKRGLTAVEASYLLELPPTKIVTEILYSLLMKKAVWITAATPVLKLEVMEPFKKESGLSDQSLRYYESSFLRAIKPDGTLDEGKLATTIMILRDNVEAKMRGYCRRDNVLYYRNIVAKAWQQVKQAGTEELASKAYNENLLWLFLDGDFKSQNERVFRDMIFRPQPDWWWFWYGYTYYHPHPIYKPFATTGQPPTTIPGAEFANNVVTSIEKTSNNIVVNIERFANSILPPAPSQHASQEPVHHQATCVCACHACACACACVSCACACAGGGVG